MGSVTALGIQDSVLDLETQILYHLKGNHYPPVPAEMVKPCIEAIDAYYDEDHSRMIDMPKVGDFQILYKGQTQAPAWAIVEQHHLEFWIELEYPEDGFGFYDYINSIDGHVEE